LEIPRRSGSRRWHRHVGARREHPPVDVHHPRHRAGRARDAAELRLQHPRPRLRAEQPEHRQPCPHYCIEALGKWEPRIEEVEARAEPSDDEPNRLDINIKYKVRATNTSRNLVYPFYIRRSDEK
jgi:hypothetical protein